MPIYLKRCMVSHLFALTLLPASQGISQENLTPIADYSSAAEPLLESYCTDCHSGEEAESGLAIEDLKSGQHFQEDRRHWLEIVRHLRAGDMPPADMPQPTIQERTELINWISAKLEQLDCSGSINPGKSTLQRLNRLQYQHTIHELVGVDFDPTKLFSPDELAYGFDNNGDVLSISPVMFEKYLQAASTIARQAIPAVETIENKGTSLELPLAKSIVPWNKSGRLIFSEASLDAEYPCNRDGTYAARLKVSGMQAGDEPAQMAIKINDKTVKLVQVHSRPDAPEEFVVILEMTAGEQVKISAVFTNDYFNPNQSDINNRDRNLIVHSIEILGPINLVEKASLPLQETLLYSVPTTEQWLSNRGWQRATQKSLRRFLSLAYRRPAKTEEVERLIELIANSRSLGNSYHFALQNALQAVLVSPHFLMIGDKRKQQGKGSIILVDDFTLASRLSYFLWGTMPDDELFLLAKRRKLHDQLDEQVARMLKDKRASYLSSSFLEQWLETRQLQNFKPDPELFPEFDNQLQRDMRKEIQLFFSTVLKEDQSIFTLLDADFTYLNERLAQHYGIDGVTGNEYQRVRLTQELLAQGRGGVLGMGSIMAVTSNPDRTSAVLRGKFVLGNLLGDEPPPPPPNVPALVANENHSKGLTLRQELEAHRADPACSACHKLMDPLGFALESFDSLGRKRTRHNNLQIDDRAILDDGTELNGVVGVKNYLLQHKQKFARTLSEKMLTFALGRGLEYYDECSLREILNHTEQNDYRITSLIHAIVNSKPFLYSNHAEYR